MQASSLDLRCPPAVRELLLHFAELSVGAYPVGGCVRDALMGIPPHDWDVAVTSLPEQTMAVCQSLGYRVIPTGIAHGTVTVLTDDGPVECTTCRTEGGYSDGRHPDTVSFTGRLTDDLSRRDFTVNAMAAELQSNGSFTIIDLFGGQTDLAAGRIRCVGDPDTRLSEDALRVMRAVRFAVKLGFHICPDTSAALVRQGKGLARISRERISMELQKILCSPSPERGIALLTELDLMPHVLSCGISAEGTGHLSALPTDFALRCACLLFRMPAQGLKENLHGLRLSNETAAQISILASARLPIGNDMTAARRLRHACGELAIPFLDICAAHGQDTAALRACVQASEQNRDCVSISDLAVSGRDLMAIGACPGKALGDLLSHLLDTVMEEPSKNNFDELIKEARRRL